MRCSREISQFESDVEMRNNLKIISHLNTRLVFKYIIFGGIIMNNTNILKKYGIKEGDKVMIDKGIDYPPIGEVGVFVKEYKHYLLFKRIINVAFYQFTVNKASLLCGHVRIHKV